MLEWDFGFILYFLLFLLPSLRSVLIFLSFRMCFAWDRIVNGKPIVSDSTNCRHRHSNSFVARFMARYVFKRELRKAAAINSVLSRHLLRSQNRIARTNDIAISSQRLSFDSVCRIWYFHAINHDRAICTNLAVANVPTARFKYLLFIYHSSRFTLFSRDFRNGLFIFFAS